MKLKTTSLILLCNLFVVTGAYAAEEAKTIMFEDLDVNVDGCIDKDEAKARKDLMENFASADADKGGTICVDEYTAFHNRGRMELEEVETPELGAAPVK